MKAGQLKHLVTIQYPQKTLTASGDSQTTWTEFDQVYAEVIPVRGQDLWNVQTSQPQITHQVRLRYLSGLTPDMRIVYGSRILHIEEPPANTGEVHEELLLLCKEQT